MDLLVEEVHDRDKGVFGKKMEAAESSPGPWMTSEGSAKG
jgi:hypothetical protein